MIAAWPAHKLAKPLPFYSPKLMDEMSSEVYSTG
jgi:hypothetical protein